MSVFLEDRLEMNDWTAPALSGHIEWHMMKQLNIHLIDIWLGATSLIKIQGNISQNRSDRHCFMGDKKPIQIADNWLTNLPNDCLPLCAWLWLPVSDGVFSVQPFWVESYFFYLLFLLFLPCTCLTNYQNKIPILSYSRILVLAHWIQKMSNIVSVCDWSLPKCMWQLV